jgi:hypothetical protein
MRQQLLTALACSAAFFSFGANAAKSGADGTFTGTYVIEALPNNTLDHPNPKCMIFDAAQGASGIRLYRGVHGGPCGDGYPHTDVAIETPARAWDIAPVKHSDGRTAHVIRNRANGQCLIRSNNGFNVAPSLYMWSSNNQQWCGLSSANALIENGQAAWVFGDSPTESGTLVSSMAVLRNGLGYLKFASTNTSLREGQAMIAADHVFRFNRVAERCDNPHAIQHDIIRTCFVGDFAQPVRFEDAAKLNVPFEKWTAPAGRGDGTEFAAVKGEHAEAYCNRLRTGGFADWRVPTAVELADLWLRFPYNQLHEQMGWSTGAHMTSERNGAGYSAINLFDGRLEGHSNALPVACIR